VLRQRLPTANELVYDNYNFFVIGYSSTERPDAGRPGSEHLPQRLAAGGEMASDVVLLMGRRTKRMFQSPQTGFASLELEIGRML
jgi:hypothetical protein